MTTASLIIFAAILLCCLAIALYALYLEHKEQILKLESLEAMMERDPYPMYTSIVTKPVEADKQKETPPD